MVPASGLSRAAEQGTSAMNRSILFAVGAALSLPLAPAIAQSSHQYAIMSVKTVQAFECSILAGISGNAAESKRIFNIGYEQGKLFIGALRDGKIMKKDIERETPLLIGSILRDDAGPSIDFDVGRIFQQVSTESPDIANVDKEKNEGATLLAKTKFENKNCRSIE